MLGLHEIGFERMPEACATRAAAGHLTIRCDLDDYPVQQCDTLIGSPPCQTFSAAGSGDGREFLARLSHQAEVGDWSTVGLDDRTRHVLTPGRWIDGSGCDTVMLEQVPAVLPVWQGYARLLRARGWSTWVGVLNSAEYGVPQTRKRAFLIASRLREVTAPEPTHCEGGAVSLFGELAPWVSMADALGWPDSVRVGFPRLDDKGTSPDGYRERDWRNADEPSFALTEKARSWVLSERQERGTTRSIDEPAMTITGSADNGNFRWELDRRQQNADGTPVPPVTADRPAPTLTGIAGAKGQWVWNRPATTIACDSRMWPPGHKVNQEDWDRLGEDEANERYDDRAGTEAIRLSIEEALILQSFRPDLPLRGTKSARFLIVGNAVPPLLAAHVAAEGLGLSAHLRNQRLQ